jgi:hypothetical protein
MLLFLFTRNPVGESVNRLLTRLSNASRIPKPLRTSQQQWQVVAAKRDGGAGRNEHETGRQYEGVRLPHVRALRFRTPPVRKTHTEKKLTAGRRGH